MNVSYNSGAMNIGYERNEFAEYDQRRVFSLDAGRFLVINVGKIMSEVKSGVYKASSYVKEHRLSERNARRLGLGTLYLIGALIVLLQLRSLI
ncbi:MAG: hypothetical protein NC097_01190 [Clostridium sp.]|nr:hypothetical protein [Prevotella sp.]MCM1428396.1 hypothetical protein [Clostridium sp.]MCM1474868.1 hypothetical protein [Muribaculaceae bacterium]